MLHEINDDYYFACRRAILDYILMDPHERLRIGIMQVLDKQPDYGRNIYIGLEPDDDWKERCLEARDQISSNLVICN